MGAAAVERERPTRRDTGIRSGQIFHTFLPGPAWFESSGPVDVGQGPTLSVIPRFRLRTAGPVGAEQPTAHG